MPESHGTASLGGVEILFSVEETGIQIILLKHCEADAGSVRTDLTKLYLSYWTHGVSV